MARPSVRLATLIISLGSVACGTATPPSSTTTQPSTQPATFALTGFVRDSASGRNLAGAIVAITSGTNANRNATTDGNGYYAISALATGTFSVHITANGYNSADSSVTLSRNTEVDFTLQTPPPAATCDASLWNHVQDPKRLIVKSPCVTVTGTLVESHPSDDGDIDMDVDVDPAYKSLLNDGNITKLNGNLHIEAICQAKVHDDVPAALISCANFHGTVPIPSNGSYVSVTGSHVLDTNHGWMEIHPISVLTVLR